MIEFKLNNKQILAESGNITFIRALVELKEANMETRPLGKQLIDKVYYNHTTVFLNGIYSYCDIAVLIIMTLIFSIMKG